MNALPSHQAGMTLLELTVSIALLSVIALGIGAFVKKSLQAHGKLSDQENKELVRAFVRAHLDCQAFVVAQQNGCAPEELTHEQLLHKEFDGIQFEFTCGSMDREVAVRYKQADTNSTTNTFQRLFEVPLGCG